MLDELGRLEGAEGWLEEFGRGDSEKRVALLLGKSVEDMDDSIMDKIEERVMCHLAKWWKKRKGLLY